MKLITNLLFVFFRFFRLFFSKLKIKKKFLTTEEYEEQGRIETEKALRDLQKYCQSNPEFWDNKLKNINNQPRCVSNPILIGISSISTLTDNVIHQCIIIITYYLFSDSWILCQARIMYLIMKEKLMRESIHLGMMTVMMMMILIIAQLLPLSSRPHITLPHPPLDNDNIIVIITINLNYLDFRILFCL